MASTKSTNVRSKRLRILFTIPNFNTAGSGKVVYDLVSKLDKTIFEPEICCFNNKGNFFKEVEDLGVPIHLFKFSTKFSFSTAYWRDIWKTRNFFKKHKFDVIHSWHWSSDISEPLAAKFARIPYVYTKKAMGWKSRFWRWRSNLSTKVIAINKDMVKLYFSEFKDKVVCFPIGIDLSTYTPVAPSTKIQDELGLNSNDYVIITVANLVKVKGIETLIEAVKLLENDKIKLLVVGDDATPYAQKLKTQYSDLVNTLFIGKKLDVRPYLAIADLFVIPTKDEGRREGIPIAPLEAMAMETIVIGSNISGIKDILNDFPDHLFPADNVPKLAEMITIFKKIPNHQKEKIGAKMRQMVISKFSIEDFIEKHQQLYLELAKK